MKRVRKFPAFLKAFLIVYLTCSILNFFSNFAFRQFFTGTWFIKTPVIVQDYGIFVTAINGKKLEPANYLEWLPELTSKEWYFQIYGQIQKLGSSSENDGTDNFDKNVRIFEKFFKDTSLKYELHKRTFNSLDYITNKKIEKYVNIQFKKQ